MKSCTFVGTVLAFVLLGCTEAPAAPQEDLAASNPDVFFFEGFESDDYDRRYAWASKKENRYYVPKPKAFDGNRSIGVLLRKGKHSGATLRYRFKEAGMAEPEALYARYYLMLGENWEPGVGGKLPGPAGTYDKGGWGGRRAKGDNGWSARMGYRKNKKDPDRTILHFYCYHVKSGAWGEYLTWDIPDGGIVRNRWYCIETYVKMNTPGEFDGEIRGWLDGELAIEKTDLKFRDVERLKIQEFWINFYYGGTEPIPHNMDVYLDNVALSMKPIGTADGKIGKTSMAPDAAQPVEPKKKPGNDEPPAKKKPKDEVFEPAGKPAWKPEEKPKEPVDKPVDKAEPAPEKPKAEEKPEPKEEVFEPTGKPAWKPGDPPKKD